MNPLRAPALLVIAFCLAVVTPLAAQSEAILHFDSRVVVQNNGLLMVTETIQVRSAGDQIRHGIYRDFPQLYHGRWGLYTRTGFEVVHVLRDGQAEEYHTDERANGIRVYLGSRSVVLSPGIYTYELTYETDRQLGFFADHDELYWNVTGNGWAFPIEQATATIVLPDGATAQKLEAYTGPQGARGQDFSTNTVDGNAHFETIRALSPGEGLTTVVSWPKGFVTARSSATKWKDLIADNQGVAVGALGLLLAFGYFLVAWSIVGRDPRPGTIIPLYAPPKNFTPAAVRYLAKMGFDHRAFAAAIMNLAVKGKIKISEHEDKSYVLTRLHADMGGLMPEEQRLLTNLFSDGETMLGLRNENYETIDLARDGLASDMSDAEEEVFFKPNLGWWLPGLFLTLAMIVWMLGHWNAGTQLVRVWLLALTVAGIGLNVVFYYLIKAPTILGRSLLDQIEGFKMYLSVAEKDRLNLENPPERTPALFEMFLPYAFALGVEQNWSEQFSAVLAAAGVGGTAYHPIWYSGSGWNNFGSRSFASSFGNALTSAIASASVAPGSSSGGGGGGFSGGGGGGGGGGGW